MRAYDLYNRVRLDARRLGNEELAKKHGYVDDLNILYKEAYAVGYNIALKEDFRDEDFKNDFYEKQDGELDDPKIGDYALYVYFMPHFPKQILQLDTKKIKREGDIAIPVDKDAISVSSKYFKDYESLREFMIKLKMNYSDKYSIGINDNASK